MRMPPVLAPLVRSRLVPAATGVGGELLHIEVSRSQTERWVLALRLSLPNPPELPPPLAASQVAISGAVSRRPAPLRVESIRWAAYPWGIEIVLAPAATQARREQVDHDDFVLTLNLGGADPRGGDLRGLLRPERNSAAFSLDAAMRPDRVPVSGIDVDYLTKDYHGFRTAMLQRMAALCRDWTDRSPADVGVTVIEALAYAADYASQYQDAVAGEAYLATARLRASVKRHARLLDYHLDDGRTSRAWIQVQVRRPCELAAGTSFLAAPRLHGLLAYDDVAVGQAIDQGVQVFETMTACRLLPALNELSLYGFDGRGQMLPQGACHAVLLVRTEARDLLMAAGQAPWHSPAAVLAFRSGRGDLGGRAHPVRVVGATDLTRRLDPSLAARNLSIIDLQWAADDALPVALQADGGTANATTGVSCLGNLVLADFGMTVEETLPPPDPDLPYRPTLSRTGIVPVVPLPPRTSEPVTVASLLHPDTLQALASVCLIEDLGNGEDGAVWRPRDGLLSCLPDERGLAVDIWEAGLTRLRFGNGSYGRRPAADRQYRARYRVGDLSRAELRPGAVTTMLVAANDEREVLRQSVVQFSNVTPAAGTRLPEPLQRVRSRAPDAAQTPVSCATLAEFIGAAERMPDVAEAVARLDDRDGVASVVVAVRGAAHLWTRSHLIAAVQQDLAARCLAGRSVVVVGPTLVPLEIVLVVRLAPGMQERTVRASLVRRFAADGDGFFAPGSVRFGQTVFASAIVAHALAVPGVASVALRRLERGGSAGGGTVPAALLLGWNEVPLVVGLEEPAAPGGVPDRPEGGNPAAAPPAAAPAATSPGHDDHGADHGWLRLVIEPTP
jgi:hypothetical protein